MEVFFYGLFMDKNILKKNGINPSNHRKGYLNNYTLKIPTMYQNVNLYVYDDKASLGSTSVYSCASTLLNLGPESCTVNVPAGSDSLWVMVIPRFSNDSTYFTLTVE